MTAVRIMRTEIDTSSPIRLRMLFTGISSTGGDILWRAVVSFSDSDTVLQPNQASAPQSVPKQREALAVTTVADGRAGQTEFVTIEVDLPNIDLEQTFDEKSDLAWITLERVGDSTLDNYANTVRIMQIQALATIWRQGSHTGILGDAPPPGFPTGSGGS